MPKRTFRAIPRFWTGQEEMNRRVVGKALDELQVGKTNNTYEVTLAASATTTLFESDRITPDSEVFYTPKSANAAGALANLWTEIASGVATIHHASSATTDRTFGVLIVG